MVWLFGGGPGLYFDFARLSFHVPMMGSVCAKLESDDVANKHIARKATTIPTPIKVLRILIASPYKMLSSDSRTLLLGNRAVKRFRVRRRVLHGASTVGCLRC